MRKPLAHDPLSAAGRVAFVVLWLFVCSFPIEKGIVIPGLGSISRLLGAAALGAGLVAVLVDARIRAFHPLHAVMAALASWTALTIRWSLAPEAGAEKLTTFIQLLGVVWLVWEFCPSRRRIHSLMQAYVLGTLWASCDTVSRWLVARQTYYQRYAASGFDPNDLALTLAISIPLSYSLAVRARGWRAAFYWIQIALTSLTILLSASRTGFVTGLLAATVALLSLRHVSRRQRVAVWAGMAVVAIGAAAFVPASSWQRLSTIGAEVSAGKLNMREVIWKAGLDAFNEHPIGGVGAGAFPRSVEPVMGWPTGWLVVAHNTFLSMLVETGLVGFALFAALLGGVVWSIARMRGMDRITWGLVFAVWMVGANTLSWEVRKPTWMIFALVLAQARLHRPAAAFIAAPRRRGIAWPRAQEVSIP
jgi:O-antigen ligase